MLLFICIMSFKCKSIRQVLFPFFIGQETSSVGVDWVSLAICGSNRCFSAPQICHSRQPDHAPGSFHGPYTLAQKSLCNDILRGRPATEIARHWWLQSDPNLFPSSCRECVWSITLKEHKDRPSNPSPRTPWSPSWLSPRIESLWKP